jgi:hypothetical protein
MDGRGPGMRRRDVSQVGNCPEIPDSSTGTADLASARNRDPGETDPGSR